MFQIVVILLLVGLGVELFSILAVLIKGLSEWEERKEVKDE